MENCAVATFRGIEVLLCHFKPSEENVLSKLPRELGLRLLGFRDERKGP